MVCGLTWAGSSVLNMRITTRLNENLNNYSEVNNNWMKTELTESREQEPVLKNNKKKHHSNHFNHQHTELNSDVVTVP